MSRISPIHYIAPSAISLTPNCNSSANDIAVHLVRGTKIKVYAPQAGIDTINAQFQEWTLNGRNRRLADDNKPYTIYARLSKTDRSNGYLVFTAKNLIDGVWKDKYAYVSYNGMVTPEGATTSADYWYVRIGDVTLPDNGLRTITYDTGILGTDQYNTDWTTNPELLKRILLQCTIDSRDAGSNPYVGWDKELVLTAQMMTGWFDPEVITFDHWTIVRDTGDTEADTAWLQKQSVIGFQTTGTITLAHPREGDDDFNGAVSSVFKITAYGRTADDAVRAIADISISMMAETIETYSLGLSTVLVSYNPQTKTYNPDGGVQVRVRANDQRGNLLRITNQQYELLNLQLQYKRTSQQQFTDLPIDGGAPTDLAVATIPITAFQAQESLELRLINTEQKELSVSTIAFVRDGEDSREREWIFLRSSQSITFGDITSEHPLPSLIPGGEVSPHGIAGGDDYNKQQDDWVPEGWTDDSLGTDEDMPYEYGSYRDYVHGEGEETGHWGDFVTPRVWSHYGEDAITYDIIPAASVISASNSGVISMSGLAVKAYRIKGLDRSDNILPEANPPASGDYYYAEYSVDGGSYVPCEGLPDGAGYGIGATALQATKESVIFRLKHTSAPDVVLKESLPINVVRSMSEDWIRNNFLSKVNDDTAEGVITFKKGFWVKVKELFGFTADGDARMRNGDVSGTLNVASDTAIGGDTTIGGTLRTNDIQSDNYTGDGMADTGFRLTKDDGTGSSKLTTDILYVRKKAVFEEVEVKKETAIAGNQIYSSAANIILRTDYFDASGNLMGYSTIVVPYLLKRVPFLLRMLSRQSRTGFFGRQRRMRMFLEAADIPKIRRVRCYFLAKDDEREIKNLWRVEEYYPDDYPDVSKRGQLIPGTGNDLARCQTMNLSNSNRTTYIHGMETKAGNVYWWRKLCGVSTQPVQGDDGREYHYFDVMFDYDAEAAYRAAGQQCPWCDVASGDIPAAGDHVVQFGNDMNPDRMNLIAVEINGDDSPATKWYRGIYTFDLSRCWWGGNPRKEMISAASGVEFYGPSFNVQTEYGVAKVPKDRNEVNWSDIAKQRDDYGEHPDVRKLYYYDAVTHGGCRWLCLIPEGMHWVRPQVWDDDAYKIYDDNRQYRHNGNYITDVQYTALTTDQKTQCGHIPNYTTSEPGTDANIWKKIVDKGANSVRIDLDNENDSMLYSSTKGLVSGNVVSTGVLFDGINDVSASATWSIQAKNCTATLTGRTVTVTAMSAATGSVVVRALYNGQTYTATLTLKKILDGDKFDLVVTPNSIAYNSTTDTPATSTLAIQVWKTACDGTRALSAPPSGYEVYANGNKLTASSTGTYSYTTDNSAISEVTVKIATSSSATDSLDAETIPVNKAANGANAVRIDLDNENDAMLYSSSKGLVSGNVTSTAHLYDGTSDVSASATWSITNSNCTATISNRVITVTAMSAATGSVTVSAQYNGKTYTAILTLKKILDTDKYDLVVTPNSIAYNSTTDTPATSTLAIQVWKTACDGTRALSAPPSGYDVYANGNKLTASSTGTYSYTTDNSAISEVTVKIATSASATDSLDAETIPINKAANGKSITKKSETYRYATNNTGTRPAASSSDWKTTKPTLQKGYWLYTETTITWSDNSTTVLYTDERNPNDGVAGQDIIVDGATVMKYYVGDSNTTHPADGSSDWKDLSQVTQTQGKWLWSQATTYYRKASSAAGSHDAGTSYNYNVSYISKDGKTGRGISSITEYYQATNSSDARQRPSSAAGWSTDPNLADLTDRWDKDHKFLWNMERTIYANVDGTTTTEYSIPQIVAIWTKDGATGAAGRGIDSIVNYYKITSTATAPSKPSTPGTDGWSTTPSSPAKGQYLWNYERITWINPAGTTETDVQMIGYSGTDGASITKASADTFRYAIGDSGITPPSSGWSTTKPSTFDKNKWLWTETTIHWSDGSTTTLYSAERNPNDGVNGQDIIVDGATVMKYYVGDSNTTHPADTSSDWKDLSQVTQTQGKWLWSQATTNYRKALSAPGSHDAGVTYNYNVSYISKDGKTGRGISSITEYYQATNSSAARTAPTSTTGWSTDPNLADLTDKWDKDHKYLWNMERTIYANVDGTTTTTYSIPQIVAIWTKDGATGAAGRGIDSIVNYYKITSTATAPSKPSTPGTDGWSTTPSSPAKGQYLWNYERITWINPAGTTETDVQMIGYAGTDGASITKASADTFRYAIGDSGITPPSSGWSTTKPSTFDKNKWLWTETTIHWSDGSTTTLYSAERNPNDGVNGQDIIVDGATVMKYYVGDSNTTHPADTSSDWKDLSQVTQTQGKWLWSQATTYYRKASSAAGSHDAGVTYNYNVSYISKDGKTGRGISSITEYYQATNSSAARTAPTSTTGWSTDPNLSDLTDKWDQNHKYLWNMERTIYANVDGTTTTTYSIPQIVAIWTKDGSAGRGIDSIVNYYKITSTATAPSKPSTPGTDGWTTTPGALSAGQYLWNYERITWVNPAGVTETDVQMIGYAGTNGQDSTVPGPPGDDGDDGWTIIANPANVILTQSMSSSSSFSTADVSFSAKKGSRTATVSNLTGISEYHFDVTKTGNSSIRVNYPKSSGSSYYTEGYFEVTVHCTDPDTSRDVEFTVRVLCYANLLGSWKSNIVDDTKTEIANQDFYYYDANGDVVRKTTVGEYIRSSQSASSNLKATINGKTTESYVNQKANEINIGIRDDLGNTGIDITSGEIKLKANKVNFYDSTGTNLNSKIWLDSTYGTLHAVDGEFEGKVTAEEGTIGGFAIGSETLGTEYSSGTIGGTYIRNDGYMRIYNQKNYTGLSVLGGVDLNGDSDHGVYLSNTGGSVNANGNTLNLNTNANNNNQVNIGSYQTASVNINGSAANFGSSTPVSVGSSLAVQGPFVLGGDTTFITNNRSTAKTVALPSNASRGQVIFAKGTVGDLTLTGAIRNDEGSIVTSIGGDRRSRIFIYGDSYWNEFYCS